MTTTAPVPGLDRLDVPAGDRELVAWVRRVARLASPDRVVWCSGAPGERERLTAPLAASGALVRRGATALVPAALPAVAPDLTLTATRGLVPAVRAESGMHLDDLHEQVALFFQDCMRGRVLYVIPFRSGGESGGASGLQLSDSAFVAAVLLGDAVPFGSLRAADRPMRAVHSVGLPLVLPGGRRRPDVAWPSRDRAWVARFPELRETWSFGTAYEPRVASVVGAPVHVPAAYDGSVSADAVA